MIDFSKGYSDRYNPRNYPNELYHSGIKGMRWGVRRYQNEDGSYKAGGKEHDAAVRKSNVISDTTGYISKKSAARKAEKEYDRSQKESIAAYKEYMDYIRNDNSSKARAQELKDISDVKTANMKEKQNILRSSRDKVKEDAMNKRIEGTLNKVKDIIDIDNDGTISAKNLAKNIVKKVKGNYKEKQWNEDRAKNFDTNNELMRRYMERIAEKQEQDRKEAITEYTLEKMKREIQNSNRNEKVNESIAAREKAIQDAYKRNRKKVGDLNKNTNKRWR